MAITATSSKRDRATIAGHVLSGLVILFLAVDGTMKLAAPAMMAANAPPLGWRTDADTFAMLGTLTLISTLLYAIPRTRYLGAILLTGYLGGAVATHARIGNPLFSHTLFGVYLGVMVWGGLWLRDPRLRALLPITR
jgi:hypothetical protein